MNPGTLIGGLEEACRRWPERIALVDGDNRLTYAALWERVLALGAAYRRLGVSPGDRVLCQLPTCIDHIVSMAASWACAAIHVGLDHDLTTPELSWLVGHTGAAALLYQPPTGDGASAIATIRSDHPSTRPVLRSTAGATGVPTLDTLIADAPADTGSAGLVGPSPQDAALILFTSGTTGRPKGPVNFHGLNREGWSWTAATLGFGPEDTHLGHLPLAHGFGLSMAYMALSTGGRLILTHGFSAREALRTIAAERVTVFNGTPAHFILLTDRRDPLRDDVSSLRTGVGTAATFSPKLLRRIFDDLGMELMLMYGSSEGVGVVTTDREEMLGGSVGRPYYPGFVSIVGPDRRPVPTGELGEIAFNRAWVPVRYWTDGDDRPTAPVRSPHPEKNPDWFYSGDIGRLDDEGRLHVVGRLKHQVDRGGIKVDPGEVEDALLRCDDIADAAVIGTPNPVLGENVCACVVPAACGTLTLRAVRDLLAGSLAAHKLPEELSVLPCIPRTERGKVDRARLRELVLAGPRERLHDR